MKQNLNPMLNLYTFKFNFDKSQARESGSFNRKMDIYWGNKHPKAFNKRKIFDFLLHEYKTTYALPFVNSKENYFIAKYSNGNVYHYDIIKL